jgi:hypothetical protein
VHRHNELINPLISRLLSIPGRVFDDLDCLLVRKVLVLPVKLKPHRDGLISVFLAFTP